jgi:hypothetical protein
VEGPLAGCKEPLGWLVEHSEVQSRIAVATDRVIESIRNGLWPGYKGVLFQSWFAFLCCAGFAVPEHGPPPGDTHEQPEVLL